MIHLNKTISFTKNEGVESIELVIDSGTHFETSYTLDTNGQSVSDLRQEQTYAYTSTPKFGWEITSGGSQQATTIGNNAYNTINISPVAFLKISNGDMKIMTVEKDIGLTEKLLEVAKEFIVNKKEKR